MKLWKKAGALVLALALTLALASCGQQETQTQETEETPAAHYNVAALKGPTAMGLVKLMHDAESGAELTNDYTFTLAASADEVSPKLMQGELDIACVPANLAAVLYQKTGGEIVTLGINTLGVLYIVENGNAVTSMADLAGKTIVASGKGSTPEYALRYLLRENGVDPDGGVVIDWKSEHSECVSALATGAATIAMLPQPFVTVAQGQVEGLRMALDLTAEWEKLDNGSQFITAGLVVRKAFAEENPQALATFLEEYQASTEYVNNNIPEAAQLVEQYDIVKAAVAEQAIPYCNIVYIDKEEMQTAVSGYLQTLYDLKPDSVGGAMPGDDFYYYGE